MRTPLKIARIFRKLSRRLEVPITGKIRLGWDHAARNYLLVARIIESLPQGRTGQPVSVIAEWMESSGIDIEDVLGADPHTLRAQVTALVDREARNKLRLAA